MTNLARPGGNVTGLTSISSEIGSKRLQILKEALTGTPRIGVLFNPEDRANTLILRELEAAERSVGVSLRGYGASTREELEDMIVAMARDRVAGFFGAPGILTFEHRQVIVDLAARHRLPALWGHRQFVDAGGLMSYAVNFYDQVKSSVAYVDRILKGSKAGDLPVQQPTKFEFVVNVRAARHLGLSLPPRLMFAADEVHE